MAAVDPLLADITRVALRVVAEHGFALGGGNALVLHGVVDRPTADIDLFTDHDESVRVAADHVRIALEAVGMIAKAREVDPGLETEDVVLVGQYLDRIPDVAFAAYGLTPDAVTDLKTRFATWPRN